MDAINKMFAVAVIALAPAIAGAWNLAYEAKYQEFLNQAKAQEDVLRVDAAQKIYLEGIRYFEEAANGNPDNGKLYQILADLYTRAGDRYEADRNRERWIIVEARANDSLPDGILFAAGGQTGAFWQKLRELAAGSPKIQLDLFKQGKLAAEKGNYQNALTLFGISARNPTLKAEAYRYLVGLTDNELGSGNILTAIDRYELALNFVASAEEVQGVVEKIMAGAKDLEEGKLKDLIRERLQNLGVPKDQVLASLPYPPPDYVVYPLGKTAIFTLNQGEMTPHWIRMPEGMRTKWTPYVSSENFEVHYRDGTVIRPYLGEKFPDKDDDFVISSLVNGFQYQLVIERV